MFADKESGLCTRKSFLFDVRFRQGMHFGQLICSLELHIEWEAEKVVE
jgi:hypothetical protein